jgi:hypothetical protein
MQMRFEGFNLKFMAGVALTVLKGFMVTAHNGYITWERRQCIIYFLLDSQGLAYIACG